MRCQQTQKMIAPGHEADGSAKDARTLRDHLRICEQCRIFADVWQEIERNLPALAPPDFAPEFFDAIRANVRREIADQQTRHKTYASLIGVTSLRPIFAAAALFFIIALGGVIWLLTRDGEADLVLTTPPPASVDSGGHFDNKKLIVETSVSSDTPKRTGGRAHKSKPRLRRGRQPPLPPAFEVAARQTSDEIAALPRTAEQKSLRLELQTSDPNVRIIWFTPVNGGEDE